MTRGDIYMANLPKIGGSVQHGLRPVLILQNDIGNRHAPTVIVAPVTLQHKTNIPTHVQLANNSLLVFDRALYRTLCQSWIIFEQIMTADKKVLGDKVAKTDILPDMEKAVMVALGIGGLV